MPDIVAGDGFGALHGRDRSAPDSPGDGGRDAAAAAPARGARCTGRVLEIGIGSGPNLPLYGREVMDLQGVDPSHYLLARARRTAAWLPFPVRLLEQSAEHLPLADASVDTVVITWALCSIPDPLATLREAHRVLVPGGRVQFVEHGLSPAPRLGRWQRRLTPGVAASGRWLPARPAGRPVARTGGIHAGIAGDRPPAAGAETADLPLSGRGAAMSGGAPGLATDVRPAA